MDRLEEIFLKQKALTEKFHQIELNNGLHSYVVGIPFDLTNPSAQKQLRATAWYLIEEIGEVLTASSENKQEEIIDVFHFLIELLICSGIEEWCICPLSEDKLNTLFDMNFNLSVPPTLTLIERLADAMHWLKAKPWKQNPKETLVTVYKQKLFSVLFAFINFAKFYELTPDSLYNLYMGKAKINEDRIEGGV